ncbi:serine hydrolase domain-containing protein [Tropicimonas sp. S265A]|uniref:serine hydrolase domain-containing protein n=1 Tax=Tropicimonas sp. S265A TaxID=3415134 RepID=UPI003C798709
MICRRTLLAGSTAALALAAPVHLRAQTVSTARLRAAAGALDQLHSLSISVRNETVLAEAFRGPSLARAAPVKSVSKSLVALCLGAALDRGVVAGVNERLGDVAPALIPTGADPRVADLTLANLVTMQAGLERTSGANYGDWVSSRNWVADALSRPFVAEPGSGMLYSTGSFHILGAALAEASGRTLLTIMRDWVGDPLGIDIPAWTRDPQGYYLGGNEMALRPEDMLRIGEMVATDDGSVLSRDWIAASMQPRTRSRWSGLGYGYGWFLGRADGTRFSLARGYGGQILCILPERQTVIAITSDPTRPARSGGYFSDLMGLIAREILPTLRSV